MQKRTKDEFNSNSYYQNEQHTAINSRENIVETICVWPTDAKFSVKGNRNTLICTTYIYIYIYVVTLKNVYDRNVVNKYGLYLLLGVIIYYLIDYIYNK